MSPITPKRLPAMKEAITSVLSISKAMKPKRPPLVRADACFSLTKIQEQNFNPPLVTPNAPSAADFLSSFPMPPLNFAPRVRSNARRLLGGYMLICSFQNQSITTSAIDTVQHITNPHAGTSNAASLVTTVSSSSEVYAAAPGLGATALLKVPFRRHKSPFACDEAKDYFSVKKI